MIETKFVERVAKEVSVRPEQVAAAVALFDKGATVPFVARYRKDATGNLNEVHLEEIEKRNGFYTALSNRRDAVLQNIEKQGKLSDALRERILGVVDPLTLEDLYLPFKKQRRTKATAARDQGLEPLADLIWAQEAQDKSIEALAADYVNAEKHVPDTGTALAGARFILAERVSMDSEARIALRTRMLKEGKVTAREAVQQTKDAAGADVAGDAGAGAPAGEKPLPPRALAEVAKGRFKTYHDFAEPVKSIRSYRLLAVLRGARLGALRVDLAVDDDALIAMLRKRIIKDPESIFAAELKLVTEDGYKRLLRPSLENEIFGLARESADADAVWVFRKNARSLLLAAPAGRIPIMGVDPGIRSGCKLAVIDDTGAYLDSATIHPEDESKKEEAGNVFLELLKKHNVKAVAIGNGTGGREAGYFIERVLDAADCEGAFSVFVNEAGASVYSASKTARDEFPELDVTVRGAISIARRLQDPLAELVKIEPRSVGVGQYQHDVNPRLLKEGLYKTIESCVNLVGVDLNTASAELLRYVSGIQMGTAQNIVAFRSEHGGFKNRQQLKEVPGIGDKTFEQCAGFLRIVGGDVPLDATGIHPEAYPVADQIAESLSVSIQELMAEPKKLSEAQLDRFATDAVGRLALTDMRREFEKPGRDPRKKFRVPKFLDGVKEAGDLSEGMVTEGVVTNVTDFGAFVDVGVHQDGLVHLSEIANRFVRDPHDFVQVGDVVRVKVVGVDKANKRISLSIKALLPEARRRPKRPEVRRASGQERQRDAKAPQRKAEGQGARKPLPQRTEGGKRPPRQRKESVKGPRPGVKKPFYHGNDEPIGVSMAEQLSTLKDKLSGK